MVAEQVGVARVDVERVAHDESAPASFVPPDEEMINPVAELARPYAPFPAQQLELILEPPLPRELRVLAKRVHRGKLLVRGLKARGQLVHLLVPWMLVPTRSVQFAQQHEDGDQLEKS